MASNQTESAFWQRRIKPTFPGHIERIESLSSLGVPDTYFTINGLTAWIELKVLKRIAPPRRDEVIDWGLRREQATWHWRWTRAGGSSIVLIERHVHRRTVYHWFHGCYALRAYMRRAPVPFLTHDWLDWSVILKTQAVCHDNDILSMLANDAAGSA